MAVETSPHSDDEIASSSCRWPSKTVQNGQRAKMVSPQGSALRWPERGTLPPPPAGLPGRPRQKFVNRSLSLSSSSLRSSAVAGTRPERSVD